MIKEFIGSWGWPGVNPIKAGKRPAYLVHLAAQVVAACQMHDDGLTSTKAYWRRLREFFFGQPPKDALPEGLGSEQHMAIWRDLKRWANETNGGRLGLVRLAGKTKTQHYLIAEPLGQRVLRLGDLVKLRGLFAARGRLAEEGI